MPANAQNLMVRGRTKSHARSTTGAHCQSERGATQKSRKARIAMDAERTTASEPPVLHLPAQPAATTRRRRNAMKFNHDDQLGFQIAPGADRHTATTVATMTAPSSPRSGSVTGTASSLRPVVVKTRPRSAAWSEDCDSGTTLPQAAAAAAKHTVTQSLSPANGGDTNGRGVAGSDASGSQRTSAGGRISSPLSEHAARNRASMGATGNLQLSWPRPRGRRGKSIYRGVSHTREGKYRAVLYVGRLQVYLGVFQDELSAAKAHDRGVIAYGLGDAFLNFKPNVDADAPPKEQTPPPPLLEQPIAGGATKRRRSNRSSSVDTTTSTERVLRRSVLPPDAIEHKQLDDGHGTFVASAHGSLDSTQAPASIKGNCCSWADQDHVHHSTSPLGDGGCCDAYAHTKNNGCHDGRGSKRRLLQDEPRHITSRSSGHELGGQSSSSDCSLLLGRGGPWSDAIAMEDADTTGLARRQQMQHIAPAHQQSGVEHSHQLSGNGTWGLPVPQFDLHEHHSLSAFLNNTVSNGSGIGSTMTSNSDSITAGHSAGQHEALLWSRNKGSSMLKLDSGSLLRSDLHCLLAQRQLLDPQQLREPHSQLRLKLEPSPSLAPDTMGAQRHQRLRHGKEGMFRSPRGAQFHSTHKLATQQQPLQLRLQLQPSLMCPQQQNMAAPPCLPPPLTFSVHRFPTLEPALTVAPRYRTSNTGRMPLDMLSPQHASTSHFSALQQHVDGAAVPKLSGLWKAAARPAVTSRERDSLGERNSALAIAQQDSSSGTHTEV
eukprot:TRINITY_DN17456_c0_g1_i1.p1 TRINITY_DN17456_c0_g1~~TRINITY_DN17456_c0_g1_i1.p1  ORF type:complete len:825 (+),score=65.49 TRINITY_DN17456_c0_g1_i1:162-2477(+)